MANALPTDYDHPHAAGLEGRTRRVTYSAWACATSGPSMQRLMPVCLCLLALAACGGRAALPADRGMEAAPDTAPDATSRCSANAECAAKDYCQIDDGCAVTGGKLGQCRERPSECAAYLSPVCGCDGQDYVNPCGAHREGVNIAAPGPCVD